MGNMSYCRFRNTLMDLDDCYNHLEDIDLDTGEQRARKSLINLCKEIAAIYGEEEK